MVCGRRNGSYNITLQYRIMYRTYNHPTPWKSKHFDTFTIASMRGRCDSIRYDAYPLIPLDPFTDPSPFNEVQYSTPTTPTRPRPPDGWHSLDCDLTSSFRKTSVPLLGATHLAWLVGMGGRTGREKAADGGKVMWLSHFNFVLDQLSYLYQPLLLAWRVISAMPCLCSYLQSTVLHVHGRWARGRYIYPHYFPPGTLTGSASHKATRGNANPNLTSG